MPFSFYDQFFLIDPAAPPGVGSLLDVNYFQVTDENDNGKIHKSGDDSIDGSDIIWVSNGDTITVVMGGSTVTITGATFYLADGRTVFSPTDGTRLYSATYESASSIGGGGGVDIAAFGPPCFAEGSRIETDAGPKRVEALGAGDMVHSKDCGFQPVLWLGRSETQGKGDDALVVFRPGAIGNARALRVSARHRILVSGWRAELIAGQPEILVPAKHMVNGTTIYREERPTVRYYHILLDRHQLINAEGCWSESFYPGEQALGDGRLRAEIEAMIDPANYGPLVRPTVGHAEAEILRLAA